ncbi:MAG: endonuclease III domain-containing protein [Elusimicrobia bacterium]|nr:endonuclease III domain-containing protein [Elusimicrobiota bacterium]
MRRKKLHEKTLRSSGIIDGDKKYHLSELLDIYTILLKAFGPRGWWPTTIKGFKPAYHKKKKRNISSKEIFEICIGAILTQNTSWSNVETAIEKLNLAGLIDPLKIKAVRSARLSGIIKSSGYYKQKSLKLKIFANHVIKNHKNDVKKWLIKSDTTQLREELLSLYGIGPETADSIILYAAQKPKFIADAYAIRIFNRIGFLNSLNYSYIQDYCENILPKDVYLLQEYHALLVELAKLFCKKKKPLCDECPIGKTKICAFKIKENG